MSDKTKKIFYTKFNNVNKTAIYNNWLSFLPAKLKDVNFKFRHENDRVRNLLGKLLLREALLRLGCESLSLDDLCYNQFGKPYLSTNFDFSISHSGFYVFCALGKNVKLGVDIEEIKPINFAEMTETMTTSEWQRIRQASHPLKEYYKYWTIKEALIKAVGNGFFTPFNSILAEDHVISFENNLWYLKELSFDENYYGHIVTSDPNNILEMVYIDFAAFI